MWLSNLMAVLIVRKVFMANYSNMMPKEYYNKLCYSLLVMANMSNRCFKVCKMPLVAEFKYKLLRLAIMMCKDLVRLQQLMDLQVK